MIFRFTIEAEKVLDALIADYQIPEELDRIALTNAEKSTYFLDKNGEYYDNEIAIEVEV